MTSYVIDGFIQRLARGEPAARKALYTWLRLVRQRTLEDADRMRLEQAERELGTETSLLLRMLREMGLLR